jgi:cytohesin
LLYQHDANVDFHGYNKWTLLYGVLYGYCGIVEWLLHRGADSNIRSSSGQTLLHFAVAFGLTEIAETLLQYKVVINAQDDAGQTPLHITLEQKHINFTQYCSNTVPM